MKRARTKKLRGGKRKLAAPEQAENSEKPAPQRQKREDEKATQGVVPQAAASKSGDAMQSAATSAQTARETNNVLKTKSAPRENASNETTTDGEVERWISLIREGGLDRKVKVKGKTGALLVR